MKKIYTILLVLLLAVAMLVGVVSLVDKDATESEMENRRLATMPKFSWSALWDGSFISELETYYSDTFPGREMLLKANQVLNRFYYFSGKEENTMLIIDFDGDVAQGGEALQPAEPEKETPEVQNPAEPSAPAEQQPEEVPAEPEPPAKEQPDYDNMEVTNAGSIIILGTSALDIPTASDSIIESYAGAINNIQQALGSDYRVISLLTPNSGQFYSPTDKHTGNHDQKAMIDLCYSKMNVDVITVDAFSALEKHKDEDIYFRTDHHWTALGAYYAYTAFCETVGLEPVKLDQFRTGSYEGFVGSMYTYTSQYPQSQVLKNNPDTLVYYSPIEDTQAAFFANAEMHPAEAYWIDVVNANLPENEYNKYMCFLSGDHPVVRITSSAKGPKCLVLKDSYGNAFIPFLTSHYSEIIVIDPREFNDSGKPSLDLVAFAAEHEIDDVLALNYPFMINRKDYVKMLNHLVGAVQ